MTKHRENDRLCKIVESFPKVTVTVVGDLLHSRVLRSNILLLTKMGAKIDGAGPWVGRFSFIGASRDRRR